MHVRYVKLYEIYVTESETYKNYKNIHFVPLKAL